MLAHMSKGLNRNHCSHLCERVSIGRDMSGPIQILVSSNGKEIMPNLDLNSGMPGRSIRACSLLDRAVYAGDGLLLLGLSSFSCLEARCLLGPGQLSILCLIH